MGGEATQLILFFLKGAVGNSPQISAGPSRGHQLSLTLSA